MKDKYIFPITEVIVLDSEHLMKNLSTTNVTNQNSDDPNKNNNGPGVENDDNNGPGAKRFDFDWDFEDFNDFKDTWE